MHKKLNIITVLLISSTIIVSIFVVSSKIATSQSLPFERQTRVPGDVSATSVPGMRNAATTPTPDLSKGEIPPREHPVPPEEIPTSPARERVDKAPDLPVDRKAILIVRHANGKIIEYLLHPSEVDTFAHQLTTGDVIITYIPAAPHGRQQLPNTTPEVEIIPNAPPAVPKPSPQPSVSKTDIPSTQP